MDMYDTLIKALQIAKERAIDERGELVAPVVASLRSWFHHRCVVANLRRAGLIT